MSPSKLLSVSAVSSAFLVGALHAAPPPTVLINEIDVRIEDSGTEFVELWDGGVGNTPLDGLVLVFGDDADGASFGTPVDLDGQSTDADGLLVIAASLDDGPAAVALYQGDATDFPADTPLTTTDLLDAVVYGTRDPDAPNLLALLLPDEPQLDAEPPLVVPTDARDWSLERCPAGAGELGRRRRGSSPLPRPVSPASQETASPATSL